MGFDTVWTPDELLLAVNPADRPLDRLLGRRRDGGRRRRRPPTGSPSGHGSCSGPSHRNPGITAKAAETLDEISGGPVRVRAGSRARLAPARPGPSGFRRTTSTRASRRLSRSSSRCSCGGRADFEGTYHAARDLEQRPVGPRPGRIPIMIGGHGQKGLPPRCSARRHLELLRGGARSDVEGARAPDRGARGRMRRGRTGSGDDRAFGRDRRGSRTNASDPRACLEAGRDHPRHGGGDRRRAQNVSSTRSATRSSSAGCSSISDGRLSRGDGPCAGSSSTPADQPVPAGPAPRGGRAAPSHKRLERCHDSLGASAAARAGDR